MKKVIITIIICIFLIAACFSPLLEGDLGTFTVITDSRENARSIWGDDQDGEIKDLIYEVNVSGGPEAVPAKTINGSQPAKFTVKPGSYKIFIFAFLPPEGEEEEPVLQAVGSENIYIKAGKNNTVTITMKEPDGEGYCTVTFEFDGKKINRYVPAGEKVTVPKKFRDMKQTLGAGLYKGTFYDYELYFDEFGKWNKGEVLFDVKKTLITEDMTLKGLWYKPEFVDIPSGTNGNNIIQKAFCYYYDNNLQNEFTLLLGSNIDLDDDSQLIDYEFSSSVKYTLIGIQEQEISIIKAEIGAIFSINTNVNLTLGKNITLRGIENNNVPLVKVIDGTLTMLDGSKITGNTTRSYDGILNGGGVYIGENGTFIMKGGTISSNNVFEYDTQTGPVFSGFGGGVYVDEGGIFIMESGTISGNSADFGGGVYTKGEFIIPVNSSNVKISRNWTNYGGGGGVYVDEYGIFTMDNGVISGNWTKENGGGVKVDPSGTFNKTKGIIYGYNIQHIDNEQLTIPSDNENIAKYGDTLFLYNEYGHAVYDLRFTTPYRNETIDSNTPWPQN